MPRKTFCPFFSNLGLEKYRQKLLKKVQSSPQEVALLVHKRYTESEQKTNKLEVIINQRKNNLITKNKKNELFK